MRARSIAALGVLVAGIAWLPAPAHAQGKLTKAQIAEYRRLRELTRQLVEVSERLSDAQLRQSADASQEAEKKGPSKRPSKRKSQERSRR